MYFGVPRSHLLRVTSWVVAASPIAFSRNRHPQLRDRPILSHSPLSVSRRNVTVRYCHGLTPLIFFALVAFPGSPSPRRKPDFPAPAERHLHHSRSEHVGETEQSLKKKGVAYIVGRATEVVHIGLVAMMCNATASLFMDACFNLPTLGLLYKTATLNALGLNSISPSSPKG